MRMGGRGENVGLGGVVEGIVMCFRIEVVGEGGVGVGRVMGQRILFIGVVIIFYVFFLVNFFIF
ncbi:hypothetical protein, partial [Bacillus pumilus]|uniref:hypothetical protein n=1 Tax=Bacillus pumilus TaxID=1408 RepID=UPI001C92BDFB